MAQRSVAYFLFVVCDATASDIRGGMFSSVPTELQGLVKTQHPLTLKCV